MRGTGVHRHCQRWWGLGRDAMLEGVELLIEASTVVVANIHGMDLIPPYAQDSWYSITWEKMDRRK